MKDKQRIILLQKQVRIARKALDEISYGDTRDPRVIACDALDDIERVRLVQEGRFNEFAR